jgi:hypothetical protein
MTQSRDGIAKLLVSTIIVVILSLQAGVGIVNTGVRAWPLVAYPMYKAAHFEGDRLDHDFNVSVILPNAEKAPITRDELNMSFWIFWKNVVVPIRSGRRDDLRPLIARYCDQQNGQVIKLRVEDVGTVIGRDGPVQGLPPEILAELEVACQ